MLQLFVTLVELLSQNSRPDYPCLLHETCSLLCDLKLCSYYVLIFIIFINQYLLA
jgi:hypothetical protein